MGFLEKDRIKTCSNVWEGKRISCPSAWVPGSLPHFLMALSSCHREAEVPDSRHLALRVRYVWWQAEPVGWADSQLSPGRSSLWELGLAGVLRLDLGEGGMPAPRGWLKAWMLRQIVIIQGTVVEAEV